MPKELHVAAAVDLGGFEQLIRNVHLKEGARDDHVPGGDGGGNQHRPAGVDHAGVAHHQVGRDDAAVEDHGEHEQEHVDVAAAETASGDGIGRQQGQRDADGGAEHRVEDGVGVAAPDGRVVVDPFVGDQRRFHRPQPHLAGGDGSRIAQRRADDVHQRIEYAYRNHGQHDGVDDVVKLIGARASNASAPRARRHRRGGTRAGGSWCRQVAHQRLAPPSRLAIQLPTMIKPKLIAELNRPIAEA